MIVEVGRLQQITNHKPKKMISKIVEVGRLS